MTSHAIVTGAHGAIGRKVVAALREKNMKVSGIGNGPSHWSHPESIDQWVAAPVTARNLDRLVERLGPPAMVVHLAGGSSVHASIENPALDFRRTVESTMEIAQWPGMRTHRPALIYASSAAVYGDNSSSHIVESAPIQPKSPYGFHKDLAEKIVAYWSAQYDFPSATVRLFSVYGEGLQKQLVYELSRKLLDGADRVEMFGTGEELRDWLWIGDAARLLAMAPDWARVGGMAVNGCTGHGTSVATISQLLCALAGSDCSFEFLQRERSGDPDNLVGSSALLGELGFKPIMCLEEGLKHTYESLAGEGLRQ